MKRNRLYVLILIACFVGISYYLFHFFYSDSSLPGVCLIKKVTGYPCPSCGTTRAILLLSEGKILESIQMNPFGVLVFALMLLLPFWIGIDLIRKKETFYQFYLKTEKIIRLPWVAILLILLVVLNWIWNLYKHL